MEGYITKACHQQYLIANNSVHIGLVLKKLFEKEINDGNWNLDAIQCLTSYFFSSMHSLYCMSCSCEQICCHSHCFPWLGSSISWFFRDYNWLLNVTPKMSWLTLPEIIAWLLKPTQSLFTHAISFLSVLSCLTNYFGLFVAVPPTIVEPANNGIQKLSICRAYDALCNVSVSLWHRPSLLWI